MITLDDLQKCIFPLIDKDQATPLDKTLNDILLDAYHEAKKLIESRPV